MPGKHQCGHTCSGCQFATENKKDLKKHEGTGLRHRACNEACPRYPSLKKPNILVQTPETYLATRPSQTPSTSSSRSSSVTGTSHRKRVREPTADEDPEQALRREKTGRSLLIGRLKLCCVLDPTRSSKTFKDIEDDVCWTDWSFPEGGDEVKILLSRPELKGYVFPVPLYPNTVKIYDWVSSRQR
jgi:hypothetical protein